MRCIFANQDTIAALIPKLVIIAVLASSSSLCQSPPQPQTVRIWGEVKDPSSAVIVGAKIVFEGEGKSFEISTVKAALMLSNCPSVLTERRSKSRVRIVEAPAI